MLKKYLVFFLVGIFCVSLVSAQQTDDYKEVKLNEYKILSQDNVEQAYKVSFSEPDENGTIQISACLENETTELINLKVDKTWYEKFIDTITIWDTYESYKYINYSYLAPHDLKIELEPSARTSYLLEKQIDERTEEICFRYSANPFEIPYIKLGDNSIIIIQSKTWVTTSTLTNITAESGASNFTHLNISNTAPYDSLVGYWNADGDLADTKLTTAYDWSKNNNNGAMAGDVVSTSSAGKFGKGFSFDGNGDYINAGNGASTNISNSIGQISVFAWVNVRAYTLSDGGQIVARGLNDGYRIRIGTTGIPKSIIKGAYNQLDAATSIPLNTWAHVGFTANQSGTFLYVNGSLSSQVANPYDVNNISASPLYIGTYETVTEMFNGSIDDVMIFNTSLTAAQILEIYNNQSARYLPTGTQKVRAVNIQQNGTLNKVNLSTTVQENMGSSIEARVGQINMSVNTSGLVAYYPFEWNSPVDISGMGNDGTTVNAVWNATGGRNQTGGFSFDGSGDYVNVGASPVGIYSGMNGAISAWIYAKDNRNYQGIVSKSNGGSSTEVFLELDYKGNINSTGFYIGNQTDYSYKFGTSNTVFVNQWYHVVGTWNGTSICVYINGNLDGTCATQTYPFYNSGNNLGIGQGYDTVYYFNGSIDDVMIFNRSLSATEILNLYNNQSANHDGTPYYTNYKNITSLTNETFDISTDADFVFPDYNFLAGANSTNPFYSPLIEGDINFEAWDLAEGDTCTYTSGNWAINCSHYCNISSNINMMGNNFSTYGSGIITLTANITNYTQRLFQGTDTQFKCIIQGIGGWFQS